MIDAENRKKLARMLNDHAGAELCSFDAAHKLPRIADFENSSLRPCGTGCARNDSRHAGATGADIQYKWPDSTGSIVAVAILLGTFFRGIGHDLFDFDGIAGEALA